MSAALNYPLGVAKRKLRGVIESIVGENLDALMKHSDALRSNGAVARAIGGGFEPRTIGRIRNAEVSCTLDTLAKIAKAFGIEPWHLLVPRYDPRNPPVRTMTVHERDLYARLRGDLEKLKLED